MVLNQRSSTKFAYVKEEQCSCGFVCWKWSSVLEILVPALQYELSGSIHANDADLTIFYTDCLLIADLGEKHHILNMHKFIGFYGCHVCVTELKTIGRTHSYDPCNQESELRDNGIHK